MTILTGATNVFMILICIRIMLTWFSGAAFGRPYHILSSITDPYLRWFRRFSFLRLSMLDLSPIAALAVLSVANSVFATLAMYGTITVGIVAALILNTLWSALSFFLSFFVLVLALRFVAYLTRRNVYAPFWRMVDAISQPVYYRLSRILAPRRILPYGRGMALAVGILLGLRVGGHFLVRLASRFLMALPF